jgi:hypothetical protein
MCGSTCATPGIHSTDSFRIPCTGAGQLCTPTRDYNFTFACPASAKASFTVANDQCSPLRVHYLLDGTGELGVSAYAAGGETIEVVLTGIPAGAHKLVVQAEGKAGGCNSGTLATFAGRMVVDYTLTP